MHAAASAGNTKVLMLLLEYGGDLRLHDNWNRAVKAWVMFQTNPTLRSKMLAFIEEARFKTIVQTNSAASASALSPCGGGGGGLDGATSSHQNAGGGVGGSLNAVTSGANRVSSLFDSLNLYVVVVVHTHVILQNEAHKARFFFLSFLATCNMQAKRPISSSIRARSDSAR